MAAESQLNAKSIMSLPDIDPTKLKSAYSGRRHRLYRVTHPDGRFVIKAPAAEVPTAHAIAALRHEYELLAGFTAPGIVIVRGLVPTKTGLAIVMDDAGPASLAEQITAGPLATATFLDVAVQLAEAVARLHDARIVHRNLNPGNIVWDDENRQTTLVDFGIATTLPALSIEVAAPAQLEGTLAYISPEQTGRTGHSVDSRTDLYSLGATFYALLTGRPPFTLDDPLELIHAHIARRPTPPHEVNLNVPVALSRIVLKLLEKPPEQRYQAAEALAIDLRDAKRQWQNTGTMLPVPLGRYDIPRELSLPARLVGRDDELKALSEALRRSTTGLRELVLVSGPPGIGKSALIGQIAPAATELGGFYITGKFDQLQRSVPFSGLAHAFRQLVRRLLTEGEASLHGWRQKIETAVAPNAQILIDVVPDLERILGPQPAAPAFSPLESRNRFNEVCTQFLNVFAQPEHPLVLFLDDLQWADAASLQLLAHLLAANPGHHLLLLGAYRDDEVGSSHPLALTVTDLRAAGSSVVEIRLGPIGADDVAQLLAITLNKAPAETKLLAELITRKTGGNPFFVRRMLHLLQGQRLIRFEPASQSWDWDLRELERAPLAENVLDLMVQAIRGLPDHARVLLETGACIGHRFDLGLLAEVSGLSRTQATDQLWPALEDGLLIPVGDAYKAPRQPGPLEHHLDALPQIVQFAHDRVQQATYSLLNEDRRRETHLHIGQRLLDRADDSQIDENLFDIVDQLDLGVKLIVDPVERLRLAELNLAAGRKAKGSSAYGAAVEYLDLAIRHLPKSSWAEHPELTLAIHRELAECAYLTGQHAQAESLIEAALEHAQSKVVKADLYSLRVLAATVAGDWSQALRWGREGLAVFGHAWPLEGLAQANEAEASAVMANVGAREIGDLLEEAEVNDAETRACMRLISILGPPAYFSGADVLTFLVTRATNLSLAHGPSPYTAYAYAFYAGLHNARTGEYGVGYAFGRLALGLARRFGNGAEESRTFEVYGLIVHPWKAPLRESLPLLREGYVSGVASGELAYAAFNLNSLLINGAPAGTPLGSLIVDADVAVEFATRHKNRASLEMAVPFRQFSRALMGQTRTPTSFDDADFDTALYLTDAAANQTALGFFHVAKLQVAYLLGEYIAAGQSAEDAKAPILAGNIGMVTSAEHVFYSALTLAAAYPSAGPEREKLLAKLRALHLRLSAWAAHSPENFAHKAALVGAEIARVTGAPIKALRLYRTAIDGAAREFFLQDEALAHELRGRLLAAEGETEFAAVHLRAAADRYKRWGAIAKVSALERAFPETFKAQSSTREPGVSIDTLALIRGSQAISAEKTPEGIFERILRLVAKVAGGQTGALLLCDAEGITLRARIDAADDVSISIIGLPLQQCPDLPGSILRYAFRLNEPVVLADAAGDGAFSNDPTVQRRSLRSVLCVPLTSQGKVVGLVYLENQTMAGAFGEGRTEVVQVLAAQAAVSLENTALVKSLQSLTGDLERRVEERTKALRDSQDFSRLALTAVSGVGVWTYDLGIDRFMGDEGIAHLYGLDPAATAAGLSARDFLVNLHPDDRATLQAKMASGLINPGDLELEYRLVHPDGSVHWVLSRGHTYFEAGRPVRRTGIGIEMTAQRQLEEQLRQSQKMEAVGQLTGGIAHDFNNLLAGIAGSLELIQKRMTDQGVRGFDRHMNIAQASTQRAAALTQRLLAFSRRQTLDPKPVDVNRLITGVEDLFRRSVGPNIEIATVGAIGLWVIKVDASQLENALLNLVINARDSMPDGGRITIETANKWIDGRSAKERDLLPGQYISVCVTDTGTGMPPDVIARAFDPFYTTKPLGQGTGLGLSMIHGFVRQSGGQIRVYSEVGQGTTMCLYLPRFFGAMEAEETTPADETIEQSQGETVLVIDDEEPIRMLISDVLEEAGYRVLEAGDGPAGLKILLTDIRIDLLITDVGLPGGFNGRQVADAARQNRPELKVLFVTGYAENAVVGNGHLEPWMQVITKPFPMTALALRVREIIEGTG